MRLRPLTGDDLPSMTALDQVCFEPGAAYTLEIMADFFLQPGARAVGYFDGKILAAFVLWARTEIITLDVSPHHRRSGLGRALMNEVLAAMGRKGCRRAVLQVDKDNTPALALYNSLGFEVAREYREGGKRRYEMVMILTPTPPVGI
jgi:ribosomal-protein-alanine N-acetyltransferase